MFVKVCGITAIHQIDWAVALGYSAIGVVLHPESARYQDVDAARKLALHAKGSITSVAVGIGFDEVKEVYDDFDLIQVYEYRNLERMIYAGNALPPAGSCDYFLYDAGRGDGIARYFPEWLRNTPGKIILSGGLRTETVSQIIKSHRPYGLDVSSGVELERGVKDYHSMKKFITEVQNAGN